MKVAVAMLISLAFILWVLESVVNGSAQTATMRTVAWTPPAVLLRPGPEARFIFHHLRKCGGSTLRRQIKEAVLRLNVETSYEPKRPGNLTDVAGPRTVDDVDGSGNVTGPAEVVPVIPCGRPGFPCDMYYLDRLRTDLPLLRRVSVVAGHFAVGEAQVALNSHRAAPGPLGAPDAPAGLAEFHNLHCLTQLRDPVTRTLSCVMFRFMDKGWLVNVLRARRKPLHVSSMTPEELDLLLRDGVDEFGHGCSNEGLRILSGVADEDLINKLTADHPMAGPILDMAVHNMQRCVVALAEEPEFKWRALDHWHPWIGPPEAKRGEVLNGQEYPEQDPENWDPDLIAVIQRRNHVEIQLYDHARDIVKRQDEYLDKLARR